METLHDWLVCGLCHTATQCWLLTDLDLTYQKAVGIAKGMEAADSNTRSLKARES